MPVLAASSKIAAPRVTNGDSSSRAAPRPRRPQNARSFSAERIATLSQRIAELRARMAAEQQKTEREIQGIEAALAQAESAATARIPNKAFADASPATPRTRPARCGVDAVQAVIQATADLRTQGGNLSAQAVADAFGVSLNQLAGWLGRTRQALSKTPDADSLQDGLAAFEQVARLRTVLAPDAFRKWLRMPNGQLDGVKPLDLLATGRERAIVAGLVEDMLTGMPT